MRDLVSAADDEDEYSSEGIQHSLIATYVSFKGEVFGSVNFENTAD